MHFKGKTVLITGASRGIGQAIAVELGKQGAQIIVAAKTAEPHPKLEGTIHSAAEAIEKAGGKALAVTMDVRSEESIKSALEKGVDTFGGIDILINNASAIMLSDTENTASKHFDLMHQVNVRGTWLCSKLCLPYLKKSGSGQILNMSPPLSMDAKWFANHGAYTMAKYGMSMCVLGMAEEFKKEGVRINALWPQTAIATAAVKFMPQGEMIMKGSRTPSIMAKAALAVLQGQETGQFYIDEAVLRDQGEEDFEQYAFAPGNPLIKDLYLD